MKNKIKHEDELKKTMDENEAKLNIAAKKLENTKKRSIF